MCTYMCLYKSPEVRQNPKGLESQEGWLFLQDKLENLKSHEALGRVNRKVLTQ